MIEAEEKRDIERKGTSGECGLCAAQMEETTQYYVNIETVLVVFKSTVWEY